MTQPIDTQYIDICGKRTLDYVIESLAKSNRTPNGRITVRGLGSNISKSVGVLQLLVSRFGFKLESTQIHPISLDGIDSSALEMRVDDASSMGNGSKSAKYDLEDGFIQFPIYHLLFDNLLWHMRGLTIKQMAGHCSRYVLTGRNTFVT